MNTRCCSSCRALPGTCTRKWSCTCHTPDRRDRHDSLTDLEQAVQQEIRNQLNREARDKAYSRQRSKEIEGHAPWR